MKNKQPTHLTSTTLPQQKKILKSRKYPDNKHFTHYLKNPATNSFLIKPTTPIEIEDIISKFDTNKSTGPNSLPNKIKDKYQFV